MAEQESGNALRNDIEPRDITLKDCRDEADGKTAEKLADEHAIPYPEGSRLAFIIISIAAAVFLTALVGYYAAQNFQPVETWADLIPGRNNYCYGHTPNHG